MSDFYSQQGGPPDPISYLRRMSMPNSDSAANLLRRSDSADDDVAMASGSGASNDEGVEGAGADNDGDQKGGEGEDGVAPSSFSGNKRRRKSSIVRTAFHHKTAIGGDNQEPPARERPPDGQAWPQRDSLSFTRSLIFYGTGAVTEEHQQACQLIEECRSLRQKYFGRGACTSAFDGPAVEGKDPQTIKFRFGDDGIMELYHSDDKDRKTNLFTVPDVATYSKDYDHLVEMVNEGAMRSYCFQRLQLLSSALKTHVTMNGSVESAEQSNLLGTDFYKTLKIDNHIHAAAAPTAKQFVSFVSNKLETESDIVVSKDGKTLKQVFDEAGVSTDHLNIDSFAVMADYSVYTRFDNFNAKYSPFRISDMRRIFLKTSNHMEGRYFAELMKIVMNRHEESKGHVSACEMRLSIYGMEREEWQELADWMLKDWGGDFPGPVLSPNNRWMIQIPRLWRIYSSKPSISDAAFSDMLQNIFVPMFEATLEPQKHPKVAEVLKHIVGIDSVDDEGAAEDSCGCAKPKDWKSPKNPSYHWQCYYLWANLEVLNALRKSLGLNTIAFRPHAGETGNPMNLCATYMLCESIAHGINLDNNVSLQYLYYLDQVGMSCSPLSNNFLFKKIRDSPFPKFFRRGLNVTLSTDDPLLFHMSDDALLEEYSVARATFDLSMTDMVSLLLSVLLASYRYSRRRVVGHTVYNYSSDPPSHLLLLSIPFSIFCRWNLHGTQSYSLVSRRISKKSILEKISVEESPSAMNA